MRIFHVHFLFFHMKPGTHCALHRARAQFVENMAWMIGIIILIIAGLTFMEHVKPSRCKIHTSASWHSSLLTTQLFSAQCCHQESISATPQPGCCFLSQKHCSALKNKVLSKKFQEIALGENALYGKRKRTLMSLQRSEPDHIIHACRRGQAKPRGSAFSDSWSDRVWCHYPHRWHCFAHCKLPSPLTLQITTAPFRPEGPGPGCRDGGLGREGGGGGGGAQVWDSTMIAA